MLPLASVIIPSFNSAQYLPDAVKSVMIQTYPAVECIVVDDGSSDNTPEVLKTLSTLYPRLKVTLKVNGGLSSARNKGMRVSRGNVISFLDADDLLLPDKIERQVAYLENHSEVSLVYGDYLIVSELLKPMALFTAAIPEEIALLDAFCYRNWFNPLAPLLRREMIEATGPFDEELKAAEDWDYWIRCAAVGQFAYLAGAVGLYRQHEGQIHLDYLRMRRACLQVAGKQFRHNRKRMRSALAAIDLTYAKHLWKQRKRAAAFAPLARFAARATVGRDLKRQIKALSNPQLMSACEAHSLMVSEVIESVIENRPAPEAMDPTR